MSRDAQIRMAAVEHVGRIAVSDVLTSEQLRAGFQFEGRRIPLINPQRGIFKPAEMTSLLSIRTVYPKTGARIWYDDQRRVHEQIERGDELIDYAFMGTDPAAPDNRWLREAWETQTPILYFLGVAPTRYMKIWPTYIAEWRPFELKVQLAFSSISDTSESKVIWGVSEPPARRYSFQLIRQRLHQATFREAVLTAYNNRCAISGLPEPRLLDAAHIIADGHIDLGQPVVPNGLPMSKIHHAAFDANLIGIDPDFRIHVSKALMSIDDGPMLEYGFKEIAGRTIRLPGRPRDYPDRDRLAERFERFMGR
ncbi:HNH endonuclease [Inquilinus sp. NPDC058860]|uniref:HNH endonuclease n=1 Tax=Inquilinus sp. NPDC058860 TaxID=3346652 RepID=UPI003674FED1